MLLVSFDLYLCGLNLPKHNCLIYQRFPSLNNRQHDAVLYEEVIFVEPTDTLPPSIGPRNPSHHLCKGRGGYSVGGNLQPHR